MVACLALSIRTSSVPSEWDGSLVGDGDISDLKGAASKDENFAMIAVGKGLMQRKLEAGNNQYRCERGLYDRGRNERRLLQRMIAQLVKKSRSVNDAGMFLMIFISGGFEVLVWLMSRFLTMVLLVCEEVCKNSISNTNSSLIHAQESFHVDCIFELTISQDPSSPLESARSACAPSENERGCLMSKSSGDWTKNRNSGERHRERVCEKRTGKGCAIIDRTPLFLIRRADLHTSLWQLGHH